MMAMSLLRLRLESLSVGWYDTKISSTLMTSFFFSLMNRILLYLAKKSSQVLNFKIQEHSRISCPQSSPHRTIENCYNNPIFYIILNISFTLIHSRLYFYDNSSYLFTFSLFMWTEQNRLLPGTKYAFRVVIVLRGDI